MRERDVLGIAAHEAGFGAHAREVWQPHVHRAELVPAQALADDHQVRLFGVHRLAHLAGDRFRLHPENGADFADALLEIFAANLFGDERDAIVGAGHRQRLAEAIVEDAAGRRDDALVEAVVPCFLVIDALAELARVGEAGCGVFRLQIGEPRDDRAERQGGAAAHQDGAAAEDAMEIAFGCRHVRPCSHPCRAGARAETAAPSPRRTARKA